MPAVVPYWEQSGLARKTTVLQQLAGPRYAISLSEHQGPSDSPKATRAPLTCTSLKDLD